MAHQLEVLKLLERLNREEKRTIVMVVHDLNHASQYAHHVVAIKQGDILYSGSPEDVVTSDMLREVFAIKADVIPDPRTGLPLCLPYGLVGESDEPNTRHAILYAVQQSGQAAESNKVSIR